MTMDEIWNNQQDDSHSQRARGFKGMTASATEESSSIGKEILAQGGNAMDALVAMQFGLAVSEPFNTGLAASGFILYYDAKKKKTFVVNGHSIAPQKAHKNVFVDEHQDVIPFLERSTPGTAVAVPGILKGMETALNEFGTMKWKEVMEPAVKLSEQGVRVNITWNTGLERFSDRLGEEAKKFFYPDGVPLTEGEVVVNENLTKTLQLLQEKGADAFYKGEIAEEIIKTVQSFDGFMVKEDLASYEATVSEAISGTYKDYTVAVPAPPNGGGFSLLYMLKLLEKADIGQYDLHSWEKYYLFAEVMRIMTADKLAYMGDPAFYDIPLDGLLTEQYIEERAKLINFDFRNEDITEGNPWQYDDKQPHHKNAGTTDPGPDTTHFIAIDMSGNIAACTSSLEHFFGSGIMVPGYGFLLNNDMTDFDPDPAGINSVEPGKYPVSMKTPTIVFKNGEPVLTLGSPGGPTIPPSVMQTMIHILEYGMDVKDAIEEPRIYNGTGPLIWHEEGIPDAAKQKLESMNFQFDSIALSIGNVQAILLNPETNEKMGGSDSSRPGIPVSEEEN
ncbi:gamma-glutamyltransferase [Domibacillus enclensis]|uniref:Glutathione hydrolase proenzyme n=1 Tax=Domibacillus enclensis TaxID=1017273 RepID=A0A1N6NB46_9BACI|nr:gamma-glutamyltransferase [Domibacillus enclensis]OXS79989.1 gamma-glutamyltransferase [Domibacillus enclensis]SIP89298.1 gamma-glutamyltranspeptidase / glutathione hydrolase [Domibacillus enclensis]